MQVSTLSTSEDLSLSTQASFSTDMPLSTLHDDLQENPSDDEDDGHNENRFRTIMRPEFDINGVDDETVKDYEDEPVEEIFSKPLSS